MPNPLALALIGGLVGAGLFLTITTGWLGMPVFAYFAQLPLMLVGLTLGLTPALYAVGGALLVVFAIAGWPAAATFVMVEAVPVVLVMRYALLSRTDEAGTVWYPPGPLLMHLTLLAALAVVGATLAFVTVEGGLVRVIEGVLMEAAREFGEVGSEAEVASLVAHWATLVPAFVAVSWIVMTVVNGAMAQSFAVNMRRNLRPTPDIVAIALPRWPLFVVAGAAAISLVGGGTIGFLAHSLLIVFLVPYFFQGLAVVHAFLRNRPARRVGLGLTYLCLVLFSWPLVGIVVVLGFVEDWVHLRRRFV